MYIDIGDSEYTVGTCTCTHTCTIPSTVYIHVLYMYKSTFTCTYTVYIHVHVQLILCMYLPEYKSQLQHLFLLLISRVRLILTILRNCIESETSPVWAWS